MILHDWQIGRQVRTVINYVQPSIPAIININSNQQRVGIRFFNEIPSVELGAGIGFIAIDDPNAPGILIPDSGILFSMGIDGDLPTHSFALIPGSNNNVIIVIEYIATESMLSRMLYR
jgi:hypothetical protein